MNETTTILKTLLDACALRQKVLANNLANSSTPGFKRKYVSFRKVLSQAVESGDPRKLAEVVPEVRVDRDSPSRPDGNNVSSQKELGMIAKNSMLYELSTRALSKKYEELRMAIKG